MREFPVKDYLPDDFRDALGRVVIAFGRVEYVIKLTVKSLKGEGFSKGMSYAESRGAFRRLCNGAIMLAHEKLDPDKAAAYVELINQALALAPSRNDNAHACWTTDEHGVPLRLRPFWNTSEKPGKLEWRSRTVQVDELLGIAGEMDRLYEALQTERRRWGGMKG